VAQPAASERDEVLTRLKKIEGQVRGIQRMISDETPCVDVLTQVSAVVAGMEKVGLRLLRDHMHATLSQGKSNGATSEGVDEVVKAVERFLQA
jgi:DNA-binding FrmR family transcriptional regulator